MYNAVTCEQDIKRDPVVSGVLPKPTFEESVGMGDTIKPAVSNGIPAPSFSLPVRFCKVLSGLPSTHFDPASCQIALIS